MRSYIDNEKLKTISDCLSLLAKIKETIEEIKFQLEYAPCGDDTWRNSARKALAVFQKQRRTVEYRLAVLRQEEKERNIRCHERVNNFLVRELKNVCRSRYFLSVRLLPVAKHWKLIKQAGE
nr:hypothetical protein [Escherichia coli]EII22937.1 hypothetical protein EC90111_0354 [Escherichia coli 9.0111]